LSAGDVSKTAGAGERVARESGAGPGLLKERSPSCGTKMIVRKGVKTPGIGVTCALLRTTYINVMSEEDIPRL